MVLAQSASAQLAGDFEPGFDCEKARNATEETICHDPPWLAAHDAVMGRLYKAVKSKKAKQVRARQRLWLRKRNSCQSDYDCIAKSYVKRLAALAKAAGDRSGMTGLYKYGSGAKGFGGEETGLGEMLIVREANGTFTGRIDTTSGLSFHSCTVGFRGAQRISGGWKWMDPKRDNCTIEFMQVKKDEISVKSTAECRAYCGASGYFDTTYVKSP